MRTSSGICAMRHPSSGMSVITDPPGSFQGIERLPCLVQQPADFLGSLGRELFIPQILFMGFFLIVPVRILLHPCFFVMLTLVITDIPELGKGIKKIYGRNVSDP